MQIRLYDTFRVLIMLDLLWQRGLPDILGEFPKWGPAMKGEAPR